jgi:glycosyltransferase involved in cell wall biosynthesis
VFTLAHAAAAAPEVHVKFVGAGDARADLASFLNQKRIQNVELIPFTQGDALRGLIRNSIATVLPAEWYEPFGLAVLESFAQERPVIASRIGALPELVEHGVDGLLIEPGDDMGLRQAMLALANNHVKAGAMGRAGRVKLLDRFTPAAHYRELMRVYEEVTA